MKSIVFAVSYLLQFGICCGQDDLATDSLKHLLDIAHTDTVQGLVIRKLVIEYLYSQPDTCFIYANKGLDLIKNPGTKERFENSRNPDLRFFETEMYAHAALALALQRIDSLALHLGFKALKMAEALNDRFEIAAMYGFLSEIYETMEEPATALAYTRMRYALDTSAYHHSVQTVNMGILLTVLGKYDSGLYYLQKVDPGFKLYGTKPWSAPHNALGKIYEKKGDYQQALNQYRIGIDFAKQSNLEADLPDSYLGMAEVYQQLEKTDSALFYAKFSLQIADRMELLGSSLDAITFLSSLYESKGIQDSAYKFQKMAIAIKDQLFSKERVKLVQSYIFNEKIRQMEFKEAQSSYQDKIKIYGLLTGFVVLLLIAGILIRNNLQKQKLNTILQSQKSKIENTLADLRLTQSQLIQSEKMASLGELTAGIAHEIQNPLNFVNNFSEVNTDLIDELQAELKSGNSNEALAISNNIRTNEEKINLHGKRADAIVKGMLQHSQSSAGKKEPADINNIADEYLRLAYHGLRAKDKTFKATLNTHYDPSIGKVNIISQDFGRLLLNLYNNAFYAVAEKLKLHTEGYEPTVSVITRRVDSKVEIRVNDNGMGIPSKLMDKIFQPFFTTKPPGQGTGLGLSLSYDIVKVHGGELKVETKEGEGAEFVVQIPGES